MLRRIRLGLIGFGRLGSLHAKNIAESDLACLSAICDTDDSTREKARTMYDVKVYSNIKSFLRHPLDAVVIASDTSLHLEHIKAAAAAGKHIFTEKPVGLTMDDSDNALKSVLRAGVKFQIGFQRRWDPRFVELKRHLERGDVGRPVMFKAYGRDPNASSAHKWGLDKNGGLFLNAAIHDYDAARFIMGKEISHISALGAVLVHKGLVDYGDIDTCATTLLFGRECIGITEWSRYATYGYDIGAEVIGTDGLLSLSSRQQQPYVMHIENTPRTVFDTFSFAYKCEIEAFIRSIVYNTPTCPGVEDARKSLHVALMARRSFELGGKLIRVPDLAPLEAS